MVAGPVPLRKVVVDLPLHGFFGLFTRLSIRMSPGGLLDGRDVRSLPPSRGTPEAPSP